MNKVYQISNKIFTMMLIIVVTLGISSCSVYQQPNGYESDGIYYNPNTDKIYNEDRHKYNQTEDNLSEIKIGSPYFDAAGNGAEQFYYQGNVDNSNSQNSSFNSSTPTVKINNYGLGGYNYFGNNNYSLPYNNKAKSWGRNEGIEVNIWNNYSSFYSPWGWNSLYYPWYSGGFGLSMGYGWNNWYGSGFYGGWNNWYGYPDYYGRYGWNNWYGYPNYYGRYGYRWNRSRATYAQPGNRYGNNLNSSINSNRPIAVGFNGRNNQISNEIRPIRGNINNSKRPSVSQGQFNNNIRPTREMRPSVSQGQFNNNIRPTREMRPSVSQGQFNNNIRPMRESNSGYNTRPTRSFQQTQPGNYNSMPSTRPSYSSPSPSSGRSMGTGSFGSGSRGGSMGGGAIRGGRR